MLQKGKKRTGFTLIELIVVIAILGILAAILVPRMTGYIDQAKLATDEATVRTLNSITPVFRQKVTTPDPFENESNQSATLMQDLVLAGYLSKAVAPQTKNAAFSWEFETHVWNLSINNIPIPLSPLGSAFSEISSNMIPLFAKRLTAKGSYGRNWGDYAYTDLGLTPTDWKNPVAHVYYKPGGSNLSIRPEDGYSFTMYDKQGVMRLLKASYEWNLIYNDLDKTWYYHSIAAGNEIDISTLEVVK
jgi:prepilin-type N-terminal cleavage/methylation domain